MGEGCFKKEMIVKSVCHWASFEMSFGILFSLTEGWGVGSGPFPAFEDLYRDIQIILLS